MYARQTCPHHSHGRTDMQPRTRNHASKNGPTNDGQGNQGFNAWSPRPGGQAGLVAGRLPASVQNAQVWSRLIADSQTPENPENHSSALVGSACSCVTRARACQQQDGVCGCFMCACVCCGHVLASTVDPYNRKWVLDFGMHAGVSSVWRTSCNIAHGSRLLGNEHVSCCVVPSGFVG